MADQSRGALTVDLGQARSVDGVLYVRIWLSAHSILHSANGRQLRDWEPIDLLIPDDFPLKSPIAWAGHKDFDDLPQVAFGSGFCLRVMPNDWDPSAGMTGFMQQVINTYRHISLGTLAGNLLPWQPSDDYLADECVVIKADLPRSDLNAPELLLRLAVGVPVSEQRVDIIDWLAMGSGPRSSDINLTEAFNDQLTRLRELHPGMFLVPAAIIPKPVAFEYQSQLIELLSLVNDFSANFSFLQHLSLAAAINSAFRDEGEQDEQEPTLMLFCAPAGGGAAAVVPQTRYAAGWLPPTASQLASAVFVKAVPNTPDAPDTDVVDTRRWAMAVLTAPVSWATTYDGRPQTIRRRDSGRAIAALVNARVLVLGCGALGAPIAEHCVRAGAAHVHVVDVGTVSPGVLVRQPYFDADIGKPKAQVLAERLASIQRSTTDVVASVTDIFSSDLLNETGLREYDLIVDSTANRTVAAFIERAHHANRVLWPALITLAISQKATTGVAAVTPAGAVGAGIDLLRRLGIATSLDPDLTDVHDDFFPPPARRKHFQPEPGCSDATFIGSTTDVSALAAQLLDGALKQVGSIMASRSSEGEILPRSLCIVRLGHDEEPKPARMHLSIPNDHVLAEPDSGHEVRLTDGAWAQMLNVVDASAHSPIGGLLLGQFDTSNRIIWVSEAISAPTGTNQSPLGLQLDALDANEYALERTNRTNGLDSHIGFWHVCSNDTPWPDPAEEHALVELSAYSPGTLLIALAANVASPPHQGASNFRVKVLFN